MFGSFRHRSRRRWAVPSATSLLKDGHVKDDKDEIVDNHEKPKGECWEYSCISCSRCVSKGRDLVGVNAGWWLGEPTSWSSCCSELRWLWGASKVGGVRHERKCQQKTRPNRKSQVMSNVQPISTLSLAPQNEDTSSFDVSQHWPWSMGVKTTLRLLPLDQSCSQMNWCWNEWRFAGARIYSIWFNVIMLRVYFVHEIKLLHCAQLRRTSDHRRW